MYKKNIVKKSPGLLSADIYWKSHLILTKPSCGRGFAPLLINGICKLLRGDPRHRMQRSAALTANIC